MQHFVRIQEIGISTHKGAAILLYDRHLDDRQIKPAACIMFGNDVRQRLIRHHAMTFGVVRIADKDIVRVQAWRC